MTACPYKLASVLLQYPTAALFDGLGVLEAEAARLPRPCAIPLGRFPGWLQETLPSGVAQHYVATFDLRRRCALHLTYYRYGDTRKRGMAMLAFKTAYRAAGFEPSGSELPDYLPLVLDFTALRPRGQKLLRAHCDASSSRAGVIEAVSAQLPALRRPDQALVRQFRDSGPTARLSPRRRHRVLTAVDRRHPVPVDRGSRPGPSAAVAVGGARPGRCGAMVRRAAALPDGRRADPAALADRPHDARHARRAVLDPDGRHRDLRTGRRPRPRPPAGIPVVRSTAGFAEGFTFALRVSGTCWIPLLIILGLWRHARRHWPLTYEPTLWSIVFPLGMYSVATLTFGTAAHLASMESLARSCSGSPSPPRSSPGLSATRTKPASGAPVPVLQHGATYDMTAEKKLP